MKTLTAFFVFSLSISTSLIAQLGWKENKESYSKIPKKTLQSLNELKLPKRVDMSKYCPSVINQGDLGTCVGVSTTYYMRTILEAISRNITDKDSIDALSFSPSYIYNAIKDKSDVDCLNGTEFEKAFEFLKVKGVPSLEQQDYPNCNNNESLTINPESKILDYIRLFSLTEREENIILTTKKALAENTPVVVGLIITESLPELSQNGFWKILWRNIMAFFGVKVFQDIGLWNPKNSENVGGHAVCLVGYDDKKRFEDGSHGAFKAVNSWGGYFAEDGFFWIRYDDYKDKAKNAFQAFLPIKRNKNQVVFSAEITFDFDTFFPPKPVSSKLTYLDLKPTNSQKGIDKMASYVLNPQSSGTPYRFSAFIDSTTAYTYLYIINSNSNLLEETTLIFPLDESESASIFRNTKVILPPMDGPRYALDNQLGTEYVLFLFSDKELKISQYVNAISSGKGTFPNRMVNAFGKDLVPYNQIEYNTRKNKMGFTLMGEKQGHIVPLLVSFEHVD
jgi:Papain family cysteine protease